MSIYIVGEIGINHNGDIEIAKSLIDEAKVAGADAVKFQKRNIDLVYSKSTLDALRDSPWGTTQREQKEGLEFDQDNYEEIDNYCKEKEIDWFASAWDLDSQEFLRSFDCKKNNISKIDYGKRNDICNPLADSANYGGGTPSPLTVNQWERTLDKLNSQKEDVK